MIINISENIRIKKESLNYNLETRRIAPCLIEKGENKGLPNPKAGESSWHTEGHYSALSTVLKSKKLLSLAIEENLETVNGVDNLVNAIKSAETAIIKAVKGDHDVK